MDFAPVAHSVMLNGRKSVGVSSPTALRCGSSNLSERKWLYIQNTATVNIFIGSQYLSGGSITDITKDLLARWGMKINAGDSVWLPVGNEITVYAITQSGKGRPLRIAELA